MAAIKEKHGTHCEVNTMSYEENKPKAFERLNLDESSYRMYEDGKVGIFHCIGTVSDEEGYAKAQPPKVRTGKTVAVIGSGPAGLAAAVATARES